MNSMARPLPWPRSSGRHWSQNCQIPRAKSNDRATQTALQTPASFMPTVWALRWKTPRSSASIAITKIWKPTRTRNSGDWIQEEKSATAHSLAPRRAPLRRLRVAAKPRSLFHHFLRFLVGGVLDLVFVGLEQRLHFFLGLIAFVLGQFTALFGGFDVFVGVAADVA